MHGEYHHCWGSGRCLLLQPGKLQRSHERPVCVYLFLFSFLLCTSAPGTLTWMPSSLRHLRIYSENNFLSKDEKCIAEICSERKMRIILLVFGVTEITIQFPDLCCHAHSVRRSRDCTGLPADGLCNWDAKAVTIAEGQPFAYRYTTSNFQCNNALLIDAFIIFLTTNLLTISIFVAAVAVCVLCFFPSCLTELNNTHVGLLWETGAEGCSAGSNACLQVFSSLPLALFG